MAKELKTDALSVGLELMKISNHSYTFYWKTSIQNIRAGDYSGLLTYCSIFYPIETQKIGFWDGLDFIGMDFYLALLNITNDGSKIFWLFSIFQNMADSLAGLAIPSATPLMKYIGNYSANFTLQDMTFKALENNSGICDGITIFW
ncbi:unnamed protein product [Adineta steineri]|uniref:Uncharacterized protein n=1 Tax=Adineta steineri TaxID=433720 RepID=A0A814YFD5_9BILA|nr:unnamed protein product [Adineta steineri]